MSREIKFRAWDKRKKLMREVAVLHFNRLTKKISGVDYWAKDSELKSLHVDYIDVMHYTGLKDKNGVEIYEGDIIHFKTDGLSGRGIVYWDQEKSAFMIKDTRPHNPRRGQRWYPFYNNATYRVDGNVHENPDLITIF